MNADEEKAYYKHRHKRKPKEARENYHKKVDEVHQAAKKIHQDMMEEVDSTIIQKNIGRPHKEIDWSAFKALCAVNATLREICSYLGVDDQTLKAHVESEFEQPFREVYESLSSVAKISLRRAQFVMAEKNPVMAIFLGKQYLGQRDVFEKDESGAKGAFVQLDGALAKLHENLSSEK